MADTSLKEAAPQKDWEDEARAPIGRLDSVLVMVGPNTHKASGVLKEGKIATEENKSIFLVIGYRDGSYTAVPDAGYVYISGWDNLRKVLAAVSS